MVVTVFCGHQYQAVVSVRTLSVSLCLRCRLVILLHPLQGRCSGAHSEQGSRNLNPQCLTVDPVLTTRVCVKAVTRSASV